MVSHFVYHSHLHYIAEKQFHPASSVHVKYHQATGSRVEDDGRLAHAGLNYSPAATDGYQSCKILTKKSHFSHETKLLNLLHDNLWTSYNNSIYISYIIFLSLFNHAPKKLKHNKIPVVWLPNLLHIFWTDVLSVIVLLLNKPLRYQVCTLQVPAWAHFFRIVQDSKVASSNCQ